MSKIIIRKKLFNKRKLNFNEKQNINFLKILKILLNKNIKKGIIGGYFPVNYEIDDLDIISPKLSPDNYFEEDKLLTLDDTKEYETYLKNELKRLSLDYKKEILKIKEDLIIDEEISLDNDIISLFKICKDRLFNQIILKTLNIRF